METSCRFWESKISDNQNDLSLTVLTGQMRGHDCSGQYHGNRRSHPKESQRHTIYTE